MAETQIVQTQWWLMYCSFPCLNWARLRVYSDGHADVLDMDGHLLTFPEHEDAKNHLLEDEYITIENLDSEDYAARKLSGEQLTPPSAESDDELLPQMFVSRD